MSHAPCVGNFQGQLLLRIFSTLFELCWKNLILKKQQTGSGRYLEPAAAIINNAKPNRTHPPPDEFVFAVTYCL